MQHTHIMEYQPQKRMKPWHLGQCGQTQRVLGAKQLQSCLTLCDPMDCSPAGSSVHGVFQARILEWVAMPSSRRSPDPNQHLLRLLLFQGGSLPLVPLEKPLYRKSFVKCTEQKLERGLAPGKPCSSIYNKSIFVFNTEHTLFHWIQNTVRQGLISSLSPQGNGGSEKLSLFPELTQQERART